MKGFLFAFGFMLVIFSIVAAGFVMLPQGEQAPMVASSSVSTTTLEAFHLSSTTPRFVHTTSARIKARVAHMSLEEKVGQMMIIGFTRPYVDPHVKDMIKKYHIGGVNLLKRNISNKKQMMALAADLRKVNSTVTDVPFLIGVDQEGGTVSRFSFLSHLKTQSSMTGPETAYAEAFARGKELKDLGVTVNFSPVVDPVTNVRSYLYSRTFATSSEAVVPLALAMMKGYDDAGIEGTIKHFPGYENIVVDPHKKSASTGVSRIFAESLMLFKKIVADEHTKAVMTAHIVVPEMDSKPATFSSLFLKDLLRNEWHYDGVIITDDLEMVSAGKTPLPTLAVEAIKAGNDMVLSTFTTTLHAQIHNALVQAVKKGEIKEEAINASVERILAFKGY